MRHRNEEDDFIVVKSTGQRVVFVAIIVYSNARRVSFCHFSLVLFPSLSSLNPNTKLNPKLFVFPLSLLLLLGIKLDSSLLFSLSAFVLVEGWFRRRRRKCIGCFD